jgi:hypothetical protein
LVWHEIAELVFSVARPSARQICDNNPFLVHVVARKVVSIKVSSLKRTGSLRSAAGSSAVRCQVSCQPIRVLLFVTRVAIAPRMAKTRTSVYIVISVSPFPANCETLALCQSLFAWYEVTDQR